MLFRSLLRVGDDVAIQSGAIINTMRWQGQDLHVGQIHLESGCKIGMCAAVTSDVTIGRGSWVTPLTPILDDIGANEVWEGAPAQLTGRCTALDRTSEYSNYRLPMWLQEMLNILLQVFLDFWLIVAPVAVVTWTTAQLLPADTGLGGAYFYQTPIQQIIWQLSLYTFLTTWIGLVLTSALSCIFIRWTSHDPGLYPVRGFRSALLLYRVNRLNQIQKQWTWTVTGQYMRALAGLRFSKVGASECDLMRNVVPELASADAKVFWSNGCLTNMLDLGAEHIQLRQLDMPANFFSGNNSVAEFGHLPSKIGRAHV